MADPVPDSAPAAAPRPVVYPWHGASWQALTRNLAQLPHALLLEGQPGMGKADFALRLAQSLLCLDRRTDNSACGACHSCRLFSAGSHPDLLRIVPEEEGKPIIVDQVRALGVFLGLRPHTASYKVVILQPAEAMNIHAANSLLKLLEEPPLGCVLLLVTSQPSRLPATIRSRCAHVWFKPPPRDQALDWLARQRNAPAKCSVLLDLAAGAPLLALALHDGDFFEQREQLLSDIAALRAGRTSPVECAVRWKALGAARVLGWLQAAVADMIRLALDADAPILANPDCRDRLQSITNGLKLNDLFPFFDEVSETRGLLAGPLDELLLLENLLIRWSRMSA